MVNIFHRQLWSVLQVMIPKLSKKIKTVSKLGIFTYCIQSCNHQVQSSGQPENPIYFYSKNVITTLNVTFLKYFSITDVERYLTFYLAKGDPQNLIK